MAELQAILLDKEKFFTKKSFLLLESSNYLYSKVKF